MSKLPEKINLGAIQNVTKSQWIAGGLAILAFFVFGFSGVLPFIAGAAVAVMLTRT